MILHRTFSMPMSSFPFFDPSQLQNAVFFDIETTGLSWHNSHVYLIGAAYLENSQIILQQWFLQKPSEEIELLMQFSTFLKPFKQLIHYNGQAFDVPYLLHKYAYYQLSDPLSALDSLDLYRSIRPFRHLFSLNSMKQKDLEVLLGMSRKDSFNGGQLIDCYRKYLQTGSETILEQLFLHNYEDVYGLVYIYPISAYASLHMGNFSLHTSILEEERLLLSFTPDQPLPLPLSISQKDCTLQTDGKIATITVFGIRTTLKQFYNNYKDYYYLPLEDTAIHKSVAIYVDAAHRQKAKLSNCYQKTEGLFFPQPTTLFKPVFYPDAQKKAAYFLINEKWPGNQQLLKNYVCDLLTYLLSS